MKKPVKVFFSLLLTLILLIVLAAGGAGIYIYSQLKPVDPLSEKDFRFEVAQGDSVKKVAESLESQGIIKNKELFYYFVRSPKYFKLFYNKENLPDSFILKSGIYHLKDSMNYAQIMTELSSGQQEYIVVSVPEGKTISQTGQIMETAGICSKTEFKKAAYDTDLLNKYQITGESAEGFLFPDTYYLTSGMSAKEVVILMLDTFFQKASTVPGLLDKTPRDLYDTIILASIVEREYRVEEEAPLIASVFTNRLKQNIGLYSCATIVYILTEIEGRPHPDRILLEDTKIDSPYNTYKWAGLTPGPISNPGLVAINAAANPPKTNYYFFQVADSEQGKHVFTTTFDEHKASHNLNTKK